MPCLPTPTLPVPTLPLPLTIGITLGTPMFAMDVDFCCHILSINIPALQLPLGITLGGPIAATINTAIANNIRTVQLFIDSLPPKCPKE